MRHIGGAIALALLTGCAASTVAVDYLSDPPGASVYESGHVRGNTPGTLYYQPTPEFKNGGCMRVNGSTVTWASGAKAQIDWLELCNKEGWHQHVIFTRPDIPGREIDMNFALQLERNGIMNRQANAEAAAAILRAMPTQPIAPIAPPPRQTTCHSRWTGTQWETVCQ